MLAPKAPAHRPTPRIIQIEGPRCTLRKEPVRFACTLFRRGQPCAETALLRRRQLLRLARVSPNWRAERNYIESRAFDASVDLEPVPSITSVLTSPAFAVVVKQIATYGSDIQGLLRPSAYPADVLRGAFLDKAHTTLEQTIHRDAVHQALVQETIAAEADAKLITPALPRGPLVDLLEAQGLPVPTSPTRVARHAAHQAIENFFRLRIIASHLRGKAHTIFWSKPAKALPTTVQMASAALSVKDLLRYSFTDCSLPATLASDILVLHDVGHFLTAADYCALFAQYSNLKLILVTCIAPAELLRREPSLIPSLYKLHYHADGKTFDYSLEGYDGDHYTQDVEASTMLLRTAQLGAHSVERLDSIAGHHLFAISRETQPVVKLTDRFDVPSAVTLPQADNTAFSIRDRTISKDVYRSLKLHAAHLKTYALPEAVAKFKMQFKADAHDWQTETAWEFAVHSMVGTRDAFRGLRVRPVHPNPLVAIWRRIVLRAAPTYRLVYPMIPALSAVVAGWRFWTGLPTFVRNPDALVWREASLEDTLSPGNLLGRFAALLTAFVVKPLDPVLRWQEGFEVAADGTVTIGRYVERNWLAQMIHALAARPWFTLATCNLALFALARCSAPNAHWTLWSDYQRAFHTERYELTVVKQTLPASTGSLLVFAPPAPPTPVEPEPSNIDAAPFPAGTPIPVYEVCRTVLVDIPAPYRTTFAPSCQFLDPEHPRLYEHFDFGSSGHYVKPVRKLALETTPATPETPIAPVDDDLPSVCDSEDERSADFDDKFGPDFPCGCSHGLFNSENAHPAPAMAVRKQCASPAAAYPSGHDCYLKRIIDAAPHLSLAGLWESINDVLCPNSLSSAGLTDQQVSAFMIVVDLQASLVPHDGSNAYRIGKTTGQYLGNFFLTPTHVKNRTDDGPDYDAGSERKALHVRPLDMDKFWADFRAFRYGDQKHMLAYSSPRKIRVDVKRGKVYASDLKNRYTGKLFHSNILHIKNQVAERFDSLMDSAPAHSARKAVGFLGYNGCGKTYPVICFLKQHPEYLAHVKITTPDNDLRRQWIKDLGLPSSEAYRVGTFESSLLKTSAIWFVDEVGRMPAGYLDLGMAVDGANRALIAMGDPTQMRAFETNPEAGWPKLKAEVSRVAAFTDFYQGWTRRTFQAAARLWSVPSLNPVEGVIKHQQSFDVNGVLPEAHWLRADAENAQAANLNARTIAAYQGFTADGPFGIAISPAFAKWTQKYAANMITNRSRHSLIFFGNTKQAAYVANLAQNPVLAKFMAGTVQDYRKVFAKELAGMTILEAPFTELPRGRASGRAPAIYGSCHVQCTYDHDTFTFTRCQPGPAEPARGYSEYAIKARADALSRSLDVLLDARNSADLNRTQKRNMQKRIASLSAELAEQRSLLPGVYLDTDWVPPALRAGLCHNAEVTAQEVKPTEDAARDVAPSLNMPHVDLLDLATRELADIPQEEREIWCRDTWTNQFPEDGPNPLTLARRLQTVAAIQSDKADPTLLLSSKKKRLPMASVADNTAELNNGALCARFLFDAFSRGRKLSAEGPAFDEDLFAQCIYENEIKKLTSKTRKFIIASATERSDSDFDINTVRIFMKSQQKINPSTINGLWKAGQTLAQMNDQWLLYFGPVVRYITHMLSRSQGDHVFKLGGKTMHDADRWARQYVKPNVRTTANDYTAYDQSQGGEVVAWELLLMSYFDIPSTICEVYRYQKIHLQHQFGTSAIMRFTGEPATYLFNTLFNEALLNLQYDLDGFAYCISGDDSLIIGEPSISAVWPRIRHRFKIVAKTVIMDIGEFCGYLFTSFGVLREPRHFAMKLAIAVANDKLAAVEASYTYELQFARAKGDALYDVLSDEQMEFHSAMCHYLWDHGRPSTRAALSTLDYDSVSSFTATMIESAIALLRGSRTYKATVKHTMLLAALRQQQSYTV